MSSEERSNLPVPEPDLRPPHASQNETALSQEFLPVTPRFIAYGNAASGAADLVLEIRNALLARGRTDLDVCRYKNVADIEYAFFYGRSWHPLKIEGSVNTTAAIGAGTLALTDGGSNKKPGSVSQRIRGMLSRSQRPNTEEVQRPTLPAGIMIFPEMRAYGPWGDGRQHDTPYQEIEDLCTQYGVPFVRVNKLLTPGELTQKVDELTLKLPELPPVEQYPY